MAISLNRYKKLISVNSDFDKITLDTFVPTPDDKDYKRGYIKRYFVQKSNDINSPIFEIEKTQYSKIGLNPFYKIVSLDWRLVGNRLEVIESNSNSIRLAEKNLKLIGLYLPNRLQFWEG